MSHPNVLKLIGVYEETEKGSLSAVTELMAGSIIQYIRVNHVNRLELASGFIFPPACSAKTRGS